MKQKRLFIGLAGIVFLMSVKVLAQCPNLNFSMGNLTNWQCYAGSCSGGNYQVQPTAQIPGRVDVLSRYQLDISGQLYDEKCNKIQKVLQSYSFSCRIGNSTTGAEVDGVEYEMRVDSMNSLLILSYAWVLQKSSASLSEQPQFNIQIKDSAGNVLTLPCGNISCTATNTSDLVCETASLAGKDWTTVGISLQALIGKKIKIYFEARDGARGGYGYAYVVAECRPMRIEMAYCAGMPSAKLTAPEGFLSYTWSRSSDTSWHTYNQRIIVVPNPLDNEVFTCKVTSQVGCYFQLQTAIIKTTVVPDFKFGVKDQNGNVDFAANGNQNWYDTCSRTVTFVDMSRAINSKIDFIRWEIPGLNINSRDSLFTYTFPDPMTAPKTYLVRQTVFAKNGCADTSKPTDHYITIYPSPRIKINGPSKLCEGFTDTLIATPLRSTFAVKDYQWSWVKKDGTTGSVKGVDKITIDKSGSYYLEAIDAAGCIVHDTFIVAPIEIKLNNLTVKNVDCWGNLGSFSHGYVIGGSGSFVKATWTFWDNTNQVFGDSNVTPLVSLWAGISFKNQKAGIYAFYALDTKGCEFYDTIVISDAPLEIAGKSYSDSCNLNRGRIKITAKNGNLPYKFTVEKNGKVINSTSSDSLTGLDAGTYKITVTDGSNCEASDTVTIISDFIPLSSISLSAHEIIINHINQTKILTFTLNPTDACVKNVLWQSQDEDIATVYRGSVKAHSYGTTYIVVTADDGGLQDSCKIIISGVGIKQLRITNYELRVYPNPTNYELRITNYEFKEGDVIEIYNVMGQKVMLYTSPLKGGIAPSSNTAKSPFEGGRGDVLDGEKAPSPWKLSGAEVLDRTGGEVIINVSHLPNGMYFIKIGNKTARFVKY